DIFAIVLNTPDDQGIGQMPESVSAVIDAVSPMIYPSHYSDGWLGFPEPNDYPGPVVANALDNGIPRLAQHTQMRPWLQAFYYNASQVLAGIEEAEQRGAGWILWNAGGIYEASWLPPLSDE
nr:putative glycoside hydrolase [Acidimicrobiia bacterium]